MAKLFKQPGCNVWYMRFSIDGKQYRRTTGTTVKGEAEAILRKTLVEVDEGKNPVRNNKVTFDKLIQLVVDDYTRGRKKTVRLLRERINHLMDYFGGMKARYISSGKITRYIEQRREGYYNRITDRNYSPANDATINRELAVLRRAFNLAQQRTPKLINDAPYIEMLKERPKQKDTFTDRGEFERFRDALPEYMKPLVTFAYCTGWRLATLLNLKWEQVNLDVGTVTLTAGTTKNDASRMVSFPRDYEALRVLKAQERKQAAWTLAQPGNPTVAHVFDRDGEKIGDFRHTWNKACGAIDVQGYGRGNGGRQLTFHSFKRTAITNLIRAGQPVAVIMNIVGHKTPAMIYHYLELLQTDIKGAFEALQQCEAGVK